MIRRNKCFLFLLLIGPMTTIYSCSTMLAASLRDAAIDGASAFVQATTTELLDQVFEP